MAAPVMEIMNEWLLKRNLWADEGVVPDDPPWADGVVGYDPFELNTEDAESGNSNVVHAEVVHTGSTVPFENLVQNAKDNRDAWLTWLESEFRGKTMHRGFRGKTMPNDPALHEKETLQKFLDQMENSVDPQDQPTKFTNPPAELVKHVENHWCTWLAWLKREFPNNTTPAYNPVRYKEATLQKFRDHIDNSANTHV